MDFATRDDVKARERPAAYEAVVVHGAESHGEKIMVRIRGFDDKHLFGPCPWSHQVTSGAEDDVVDLPQAGDRCLVMFSDPPDPSPWVVAYWRGE